ncbi:hypothetical protein IWQ54_006594 [Labrenzia sp. EL_195]|nr:hypothetical protein [Labrenzia sp. EL_195]
MGQISCSALEAAKRRKTDLCAGTADDSGNTNKSDLKNKQVTEEIFVSGVTLNQFERQLQPQQIVAYQRALCVPATGKWGHFTRAAIVKFYEGAGDPRPRITKSGFIWFDVQKLDDAVRQSPTCNALGFHSSAFQLGKIVE